MREVGGQDNSITRMEEAHREMGKGERERSQRELKAEQLGTLQGSFPAPLGLPPRANCGKEGVQVESTPRPREPRTKLVSRGPSLVSEVKESEAVTRGWETLSEGCGGGKWLGPFVQRCGHGRGWHQISEVR